MLFIRYPKIGKNGRLKQEKVVSSIKYHDTRRKMGKMKDESPEPFGKGCH